MPPGSHFGVTAPMLCERDRSGYRERMARPGRTEPDSVSIWLKLSEVDAARMTQVLARPEFAGWTRAEWCLEMIQTALGYYTRPRPAAEPDRTRAPAAEPAAGAAPAEEPVAAAPEPGAGAPEPVASGPEAVADGPELLAQEECSNPADAGE